MIKEFARHHMKTHEIKIDEEISHIIWARGVRSPPRKIRVLMTKTDEGHILVSPYQDDVDTSVKPEQESTPEITDKVEPEQSEEIVEVDVGEKIEEAKIETKEAPKKEAPKKEATKKEATKKAAPKKEATKKAAPKKEATKKAAPKKEATKKVAPKKSK
jgi:large subunit ribosomal protein L31e